MNAMPRYRIAALLLASPWVATAADGAGGERCPRGECEAVTIIQITHTKARAGTRVEVPILVRDAAGTPLGREKALGARIEGLAFRVRFLPANAVTDAHVRRAGATADAVPRFEAAPRTEDGIAYLGVFDTRQVEVGLDPASKPQAVAVLELTLAPGLAPRTRVELRLDPASTVLSNAAGTVSESVANGYIRLLDGSITVD
jgi:hypothetical protein